MFVRRRAVRTNDYEAVVVGPDGPVRARAVHFNGRNCTVLASAMLHSSASIAPRFSLSGFWPEIERTGATMTTLLAAEVISCKADPIIHTGQLGTALPAKLVNNLLMAANSQLLAESIDLGARLGVKPPALLAALEHMSGGS